MTAALGTKTRAFAALGGGVLAIAAIAAFWLWRATPVLLADAPSRPACFSVSLMFVLSACSAGANPNSKPVAIVTVALKNKTVPFRRTS